MTPAVSRPRLFFRAQGLLAWFCADRCKATDVRSSGAAFGGWSKTGKKKRSRVLSATQWIYTDQISTGGVTLVMGPMAGGWDRVFTQRFRSFWLRLEIGTLSKFTFPRANAPANDALYANSFLASFKNDWRLPLCSCVLDGPLRQAGAPWVATC